MIKLAKGNRHSTSRDLHSQREDTQGFKVNWITQQTHRQNIRDLPNPIHVSNLRDNSHLRHLKMCLKKEINLIPAQNNEAVEPVQRIAPSQESPAANSQKNSCQKRAKLSLFSKRPSLRKISDFISFNNSKDKENSTEEAGEKQICIDPKELDNKRQGKRCIRISSRRQGLVQITKN